MKFRIRFASQIVGVFVLIALGFIVFIVVSMGINQRWFAKNYQYYSIFQTGEGLSVGMGIMFRGFQIGKVSGIELNEENDVRLDFYIHDTYIDKVNADSILQLRSNPFGSELLLHQGKEPTEPPPEASLIPAMDSKAGRILIQTGKVIIPRSEDTIGNILESVDPVLENVNNTLISLNTVLRTTDDLLQGNNTGPVNKILDNVNAVVKNVEEASSRISTLVNETTVQTNLLLQSINEISSNLEQTSAELRDPTGLVPRLLDPSGSVATLLNDDDVLFRQIENILEEINKSTAEIRRFTEFLNNSSPQLTGILEEGRQALDQGIDVLEGIRNNPLIRGGISEDREQPSTLDSYRGTEF